MGSGGMVWMGGGYGSLPPHRVYGESEVVVKTVVMCEGGNGGGRW